MSQPTDIKTPEPCTFDHFFQSGSWDGPKYYRICTDTTEPFDSDGLGFCCYWIEFYDRLETYTIDGHQLEDYHINVTAILFDGEDCSKRKNGEIIHAFHNAWLKKLTYDNPGFFSKHMWPYFQDGNFTQEFFSTGNCYQYDLDENGNKVVRRNVIGGPIPCFPEETFCCRFEKQIFIQNGKVTHVDSIFGVNEDPLVYVLKDSSMQFCTCYPQCDEVLKVSDGSSYCEAPCNTGQWTPQPDEYIDIPGCPGCTVTVTYKTRRTDPCPDFGMESVNDIYLENIEIPSVEYPGTPTACDLCGLGVSQVHNIVMDFLLRNKFEVYPPDGQCKTNYRIITAACWQDTYFEGIGDEPWDEPGEWPPYRLIHSCGDENCCYTRYQICKDLQGETTYSVLNSYSDVPNCAGCTAGGTFICDTE